MNINLILCFFLFRLNEIYLYPQRLNRKKFLEEVNSYVMHIKNFWDNYNIKIQYQIEHKLEHFAPIFYVLKAHYVIDPFFGEELVFKCRGLKNDEDSFYKNIAKILFQKLDPIVSKETFLNWVDYMGEQTETIAGYTSKNGILPGEKKKIHQKIK